MKIFVTDYKLCQYEIKLNYRLHLLLTRKYILKKNLFKVQNYTKKIKKIVFIILLRKYLHTLI